jgi:hypothetical protein
LKKKLCVRRKGKMKMNRFLTAISFNSLVSEKSASSILFIKFIDFLLLSSHTASTWEWEKKGVNYAYTCWKFFHIVFAVCRLSIAEIFIFVPYTVKLLPFRECLEVMTNQKSKTKIWNLRFNRVIYDKDLLSFIDLYVSSGFLKQNIFSLSLFSR